MKNITLSKLLFIGSLSLIAFYACKKERYDVRYSGADIASFTASGVTVTKEASSQGQIDYSKSGEDTNHAIPITVKLSPSTPNDVEVTASQAIVFTKESQGATVSATVAGKIHFTVGKPKIITVISQDQKNKKYYQVTLSKPSKLGRKTASPGAPSGLSAQPTPNSAQLTWTKPTSTGKKSDGTAAAIVGYRLSVATDALFSIGNTQVKAINGDVETYALEGMKPAAKYWLKLEAKNDSQDPEKQYGQASETLSFTTLSAAKAYDLFNNKSQVEIYPNSATLAQLTSAEKGYTMRTLIKVVPQADRRTIKVSNFTPLNLEKVEIWAKIEGFQDSIRLLDISKVKGYTTTTIAYPFTADRSLFLDKKGKVVDLSRFKTGIPTDQITFDYTGNTPTMQKLVKLKVLDWNMQYKEITGRFWTDNYTKDMTPRIIRIYGGYMINLGYIFAYNPALFRRMFMAEPMTVDSPTPTLNEQGTGLLMSRAEKRRNLLGYYKQTFKIGIADGILARGAAATPGTWFGVSLGVLRGSITPTTLPNGRKAAKVSGYLFSGTGGIGLHEIGHKLGYSHSSNMTSASEVTAASDGFGAVVIGGRVHSKIVNGTGYPVTKENYYRRTDINGNQYYPEINN